MLARILALLVFVIAAADAQQAATVRSFVLPPGEDYFGTAPFRNQPATFVLTPKLAGARNGRLWIRNTQTGLLIVGKVDGPDPQWSTERGDLLTKDHIEVWIAGATAIRLPPVEWAMEELNSADDCLKAVDAEPASVAANEVEECKTWYAKQTLYRTLLKRLFVRQFVFTSHDTVEAFATSAYDQISSKPLPIYVPSLLDPKLTTAPQTLANIRAGFRRASPNDTGYAFQISIPYEAFPPLRQLAVQDLWIMVNVFNSAEPGQKEGPYSTSAANGKWGNPSTFNRVRFDHPHRFILSPCEVELSEEGGDGKDQQAWFFPTGNQDILRSDFILENYRAVFGDWGAEPSPMVHIVNHFWKELPGGGYVCGPDLAYKKGNTKSDAQEDISETGFDVKALPNGWTLVKSGPEVEQPENAGQCGGCPYARLRIWSIDPQGSIDDALDIDQQINGEPTSAADLSLSRDWQWATLFEATGEDPRTFKWTATSYCLQGHTYQNCGKQENARPPNPPNLPGLRW